MVGLAGFTAFTVFTLTAGAAVYIASINPDYHKYLHTVGFANDSLVERLALGVAAASHLPQSQGGIALDYAFSLFTIGLALFLLRLRPRHRTARLLAVGMIGTAATFNLQAYSVFESMTVSPLEVAGNFVFQFITTAAYVYALLTFPDGTFIPRWPRIPLVALYGLGTALVAFGSFTLLGAHKVSVIILFGLIAPVAGVLSQAYRQRRSHDEAERQQSRLLFWAMTPALLLGLVVASLSINDILFPQLQGRAIKDLPVTTFRIFQPVFTIIPVALVVGIARYRLWDVDRLISRTLVYGALAAFVGAIYLAVVIGIGSVVGSSVGNVFLSIVATGIAAAAFAPLRSRFQKLANRLVYGQRATPYEVLSQLSQRLTDSVDTEELMVRMAQVLAEGTGAASAQVWIKVGSELRPSAAWPGQLGPSNPIQLTSDHLPEVPGARVAVPVRHQGELLGALAIAKPAGENLTDTEQKLVTDLASQAGLVLRNVGLTAELLARLDDLTSSRQRIVAAGNDARKRLERNIHDGAQQQLVALMVRLNLAERVAEKESPRVKEMLTQLKADTADALETLRDLARGIYPPLLASNGLAAALQAHANKLSLPVSVESDGVERYDEETEAAVYFCCLEALQNVVKYAESSHATVRLNGEIGGLEFKVADDGRGFDLATYQRGAGTQNMIDRVEALGGNLEIKTAPGEGTSIIGKVPAEARIVPARAASA
jgi:signal transduction histidine kinase